MKKSTRKPRTKKPRMKSIMHFFENNPPKNPVVAEMRAVFADRCAKSPMLTIPRTYLLAFGDLHTAAFVQHVAYLMERSADDHGWVYHTNWHLSQELHMTEDRLGDIKVKLEAKGLLKTFYDRRLHRLNYCLVPGAIRNLLDSKGIVTGNEEVDLGVKKPRFLQKMEHSAETGVEGSRKFSDKKTIPEGFQENREATSGSASGHSHSHSEALPTAEPSTVPSSAPEAQPMPQQPEVSANESPAATHSPAISPEAQGLASGTGSGPDVTIETVKPTGSTPALMPWETTIPWDSTFEGFHANNCAAVATDLAIPWTAAWQNPDACRPRAGVRAPLPEDHPLQVALKKANGHIDSVKCLETIQGDDLAKKFLRLFPASRFTAGQAGSFYKQVFRGRMTAGFVEYLCRSVRAQCPGQFTDVSDFFYSFCVYQFGEYQSAVSKRREHLAREYVAATVNRVTNEEIVKEFSRKNTNCHDYLPVSSTATALAAYVTKYPFRFGALVLGTGATWEEATRVAGENFFNRAKREREWCLAHPGRTYLHGKDEALPAILQHVNFKWSVSSAEEFSALRNAVRKFVPRHAWVLQRFTEVAPFWGLEIDAIRADAEVHVGGLANELENLGWDPIQHSDVADAARSAQPSL